MGRFLQYSLFAFFSIVLIAYALRNEAPSAQLITRLGPALDTMIRMIALCMAGLWANLCLYLSSRSVQIHDRLRSRRAHLRVAWVMSSISRLSIGRLHLLRPSYALHMPAPDDHLHGKRQVGFSILVRFRQLTPLLWPTSHRKSNAEDWTAL